MVSLAVSVSESYNASIGAQIGISGQPQHHGNAIWIVVLADSIGLGMMQEVRVRVLEPCNYWFLNTGPMLPTVSQAEQQRRGPHHDPSVTLRTATTGFTPQR